MCVVCVSLWFVVCRGVSLNVYVFSVCVMYGMVVGVRCVLCVVSVWWV